MKKAAYPDVCELSHSQLDRIGERIRTGNESDTDIRNLDKWRASHLYPMNTFRVTLMEKSKGMSGRIVAQRLKRLPTIVQKLKFQPYMNLSRMQDVGGLRAILKTNREVYALAEYYKNGKLSHPIRRYDDYIAKPKHSGYRSVHIVFEYRSTQSRNKVASDYDGLLLELQLRTELQHLWATSVEIAGLIKSQKLKNGRGDRDWLKFFRNVSDVFTEIEAADEPSYISSKLAKEEVIDRFQEIKKLDEKKQILEQLHAFSAGVNIVVDKSGRGKYVIIALDLEKHRVNVSHFSERDYEKALEKYANLERSGEFADQVLVSVGVLRQLKKAYPNYFIDIKKFINRIRGMIDATE